MVIFSDFMYFYEKTHHALLVGDPIVGYHRKHNTWEQVEEYLKDHPSAMGIHLNNFNFDGRGFDKEMKWILEQKLPEVEQVQESYRKNSMLGVGAICILEFLYRV